MAKNQNQSIFDLPLILASLLGSDVVWKPELPEKESPLLSASKAKEKVQEKRKNPSSLFADNFKNEDLIGMQYLCTCVYASVR